MDSTELLATLADATLASSVAIGLVLLLRRPLRVRFGASIGYAAWLLVPYIAWILFATVLNYEFLRLNPAADGVEGSYAVQRIEL